MANKNTIELRRKSTRIMISMILTAMGEIDLTSYVITKPQVFGRYRKYRIDTKKTNLMPGNCAGIIVVLKLTL